jgi:hypothetical protein
LQINIDGENSIECIIYFDLALSIIFVFPNNLVLFLLTSAPEFGTVMPIEVRKEYVIINVNQIYDSL